MDEDAGITIEMSPEELMEHKATSKLMNPTSKTT
jgi:hypothetical protein